MSACQSVPAAGAPGELPAREAFALPPGADPIRISQAVVTKVAELLQEEGVKDATLMRRFCQAVREADARLASP